MKIKREVTLKDRLSLLVVVGLSSLLVVGCAGKADICASAVEHLENCTGLDLQVPDACDPVEANRILNTDCAVLAAGETRTTSGFWDWLTGKPSGDGSAECYCDDVCKSKGDCCPGCPNSGNAPGGAGPSGQLQSGRGSCKGRCGNSPSGGPWPGKFPTCYCDNVCKSKGDCCPDYDAVCASTNSPGTNSPGNPSCSKKDCEAPTPLPGSSPACYCDGACKSKGDCCPFYDAVCLDY